MSWSLKIEPRTQIERLNILEDPIIYSFRMNLTINFNNLQHSPLKL